MIEQDLREPGDNSPPRAADGDRAAGRAGGSDLPGFFRLPIAQRRARVAELAGLSGSPAAV